MRMHNRLFNTVAVVAVLALGACGSKDKDGADKEPKEPTQPTKPEGETVARGETATGPACDSISVPSLNGPQGNIGTFKACSLPVNCTNGHAGTTGALGAAYCKQFHNTTCAPGDCPLPQDCVAEYSTPNSSGLVLNNCASAPDPACTVAGTQMCQCDIEIAAGGRLACGCACRNP